MLKTLWEMNKAEHMSRCNSFINAISKVYPAWRNSDIVYTESKKKQQIAIVANVFWLIGEIIRKTLYCAIFLLLPHMLFSRYMAAGGSGFELENCFVYFALIMSGFCGSIINSTIFDYDKNSYMMLKIVRVSPRNLFRMRLVRKSVREFISYTVALTICGMSFVKAMFLALLIVFARYFGETFNIMMYRITKKTIFEIKGFNVIIMFISLLLAYFVPYIRGCVPNAYSWVFESVFFAAFLVLSALFIYYVWNYTGYGRISARLYTIAALKARYEDDEEIISSTATEEHIKQPNKETFVGNVYGFDYLNRIFFVRNRKKIMEGFLIKALIILAALTTAIIAAIPMENGEVVYKVITYSPSVLVFVMYLMSGGSRMSKMMFAQCDAEMLKHRYYRENHVTHFFIRLRYMLVIDIIPALLLSAAYIVAAIISGQSGVAQTVIYVCISVLVLSCFFSVYNLFMYYIFQPYDENGEVKNKLFSIINSAMYLVAYACVFINTTPLFFACAVGAVLAVMMAASTTLVYKLGPVRFRL